MMHQKRVSRKVHFNFSLICLTFKPGFYFVVARLPNNNQKKNIIKTTMFERVSFSVFRLRRIVRRMQIHDEQNTVQKVCV